MQAQDTTQAYPWRLSYFPYLTASPNDGVMAIGRVLFFRQSRWDDRVSLHSGVAIEGGYSTHGSWLTRVRGDFPRLGDGWRLQAIAQAGKEANYSDTAAANRLIASGEVTRRIDGPFSIALRGSFTHISFDNVLVSPGVTQTVSSTDYHGRIGLVVDQRDREFDTRSGSLIQGGFFWGWNDASLSRATYTGVYGLASGWLALDSATTLTARAGVRLGRHPGFAAGRIMPAWEDEFVMGGGPESNRGLSGAARVNQCSKVFGAELRRDLKIFPGGAIAVLAFVDGIQADNCGADVVTVALRAASSGYVRDEAAVISPGVGISVRLLRNAILTATVAHAEGATRVYVSSGWSW